MEDKYLHEQWYSSKQKIVCIDSYIEFYLDRLAYLEGRADDEVEFQPEILVDVRVGSYSGVLY